MIVHMGKTKKHVESLRQASTEFRAMIVRLDLGASEIGQAKVYEQGQHIATVSYNGRVWGTDGKEITA